MNGVADFQEFVAALRAAFPNPHVAIESIVAIDSRTSTKVRVTGTLEVAGRGHAFVSRFRPTVSGFKCFSVEA